MADHEHLKLALGLQDAENPSPEDYETAFQEELANLRRMYETAGKRQQDRLRDDLNELEALRPEIEAIIAEGKALGHLETAEGLLAEGKAARAKPFLKTAAELLGTSTDEDLQLRLEGLMAEAGMDSSAAKAEAEAAAKAEAEAAAQAKAEAEAAAQAKAEAEAAAKAKAEADAAAKQAADEQAAKDAVEAEKQANAAKKAAGEQAARNAAESDLAKAAALLEARNYDDAIAALTPLTAHALVANRAQPLLARAQNAKAEAGATTTDEPPPPGKTTGGGSGTDASSQAAPEIPLKLETDRFTLIKGKARWHIVSAESVSFGRRHSNDITVFFHGKSEDAVKDQSVRISREQQFSIRRVEGKAMLKVPGNKADLFYNGRLATGQQLPLSTDDLISIATPNPSDGAPFWSCFVYHGLEPGLREILDGYHGVEVLEAPESIGAVFLDRGGPLGEHSLIVWGAVNLKKVGIASTDCWLLRQGEGFLLASEGQLAPADSKALERVTGASVPGLNALARLDTAGCVVR